MLKHMRSFLLLVFLILRWKDFERANVKRAVTLILPLIIGIDQINYNHANIVPLIWLNSSTILCSLIHKPEIDLKLISDAVNT